jgi:hypothetical protein
MAEQHTPEVLTDAKTHQRKKLNSSVHLNKREGVWWLTLSYDEEVQVETAPDAPVVGIDVGIASATRPAPASTTVRSTKTCVPATSGIEPSVAEKPNCVPAYRRKA